MEEEKKEEGSANQHPRIHWSRLIQKKVWVTGLVLAVLALVLGGSTFVYAQRYEEKIYPGTFIGNVDIGNKTVAEASALLQQAFQEMLSQGERLDIEGTVGRIDLHITGAEESDLSYDLLSFDADNAAQEAFNINHGTHRLRGALASMPTVLFKNNITPTISVRTEQLASTIRGAFPNLEQSGADTSFAVTWEKNTPIVTVTPGTEGLMIDTAQAATLLLQDAQDFTLSGITLQRTASSVTVTTEEATPLIPEAKTVLENAPFTLHYTTQDKQEHTWDVDQKTLAQWIRPIKKDDGTFQVGLDTKHVSDFLLGVHSVLDVAAQDAKFTIEGEKVTEFLGSQSGVQVDDAATTAALEAALLTKEATIEVVVSTTEPTVSTGSVNNLGIKELLGTGYSNYGRSPANRIKNIAHGSGKLNGTLIAPGETFSAIEHLAPFTLEDGYFPELVILGDEIKPEIGGGLCQIGTTLFRAAMNSGLDIVERRNHSLLVSYYNDPTNGKPGTDATLYEPNPDLKFTNTTGNYILLMTSVNQQTGDLYFTFWGTSDGRKAWYDPPVVLSTSPAGEDRITQTTTLAPGVEKCQSAHPGASTNFTYHILAADGTETTKDFSSYYRPLPKICLVGIDPAATPPVDNGTTPSDPAATPLTDTTDITTTDTPTTPAIE